MPQARDAMTRNDENLLCGGRNLQRALRAAACMLIAVLAGCASSSQVVLIGTARPAISPDQVKIYLEPPDATYEQIANLAASSEGSFAITAAGKMDEVVGRLKRLAAKLGANGLLLHGVGDLTTSPAVGAAVGYEDESARSPYGLGFHAWAFFYQKAGDGVAIYVKPK
jgi:hypothetical protein